MPFADFLASPKAYLKTHRMTIVNNGTSLNLPNVAAPNPYHGTSVHYTHAGNVQLNTAHGYAPTTNFRSAMRSMHVLGKRAVDYRYATGGAFANFRALPYQPGTVTFMRLDGGASFVVTGPINGCTIAVTHFNGQVWMFHANVNAGGGDDDGVVDGVNLMTKRAMIAAAGATVGIPVGGHYRFCEYSVGAHGPTNYDGNGLVWGHISGGRWKFYVHYVLPGAGMNAATATSHDKKWAEI